jgi:ankyrin repeat protein
MQASEALFAAVKAGDVGQVGALMDAEPALVNARGSGDLTPLMTATYWGRREVADTLIARGAEVDLHAAAALGLSERVAGMLDRNPEAVNRHSADGWTPLALAAYFGQAETAQLLLERGADHGLASTNAMRNQPLHAAVAGKRVVLVELLLQAGADHGARDYNGWTPLNLAAHEGPAESVARLLDAGADPTIANDEGRTPLATAIHEGQPEVEHLLRERGIAA